MFILNCTIINKIGVLYNAMNDGYYVSQKMKYLRLETSLSLE